MTSKFDYIVIGSGLAGLTFALRASENAKVCVLTKANIAESNTTYAQGGIAAAVGERDTWQLHEQDTLIAGAGLCDPEAVRFLVQNAPDAIAWLQSLGARFDINNVRDLDLGREGGHSMHRIVHHADKTGWEVERAVSEAVRQNKNITVFEYAFVTKLHIIDGRCAGVTAEINDLGVRNFTARAVMLASGGCGKVYAHTTNPRIATGDGIGLAIDAGAVIENMEFMQFHPTTLYHNQLPGFLITEAVRGAGGILKNHLGRRFMYDYDERLELAPRDIVARSIEREMAKLETWCVYLDATHLKAEDLKHEFPTIWERLRTVGIEIEKQWIPVVPAQHYSCGGIKTDLKGRSSIPGLYASGEVASTGVHGANRLASNSLLEAMVFSTSAAEAVQDEPWPAKQVTGTYKCECIAESEAIRIRHAFQRVMSQHVGVFRTNAGLKKAKSTVDKLLKEYEELPKTGFSGYSQETRSLLLTAKSVIEGAIARKVNIGLHYNKDLEESSATPNPAASE